MKFHFTFILLALLAFTAIVNTYSYDKHRSLDILKYSRVTYCE